LWERTRVTVWKFAAAALLVAAVTAISVLADRWVALPDIVALYLCAITVSAFRLGRVASLAAAALSVAAYNFFFIPPYHTLHVSDVRHLLTFAMMFASSFLVSGLVARIHGHEREHARLGEEAQAAALRARTEEIRASLLSAVSHDLRTPLAAITGAATALQQSLPSQSSAARVELIATICEEAERLERLVRNLLDMTRLESGAMVVKRDWVPLEEIVGSALARLESRFEGRAVATRLARDLPLVSVDPILLEQVLFNLLDNALKYTPMSTPLEIEAREDGDSIAIEVADRGPGLPADAGQKLFEKFFRGDDRASGVGLGLAICRGILRAHGGELTARNRRNGGARFCLTLPRLEGAPTLLDAAVPASEGATV
jgi:K+-sensing histidine kinase KdpD